MQPHRPVATMDWQPRKKGREYQPGKPKTHGPNQSNAMLPLRILGFHEIWPDQKRNRQMRELYSTKISGRFMVLRSHGSEQGSGAKVGVQPRVPVLVGVILSVAALQAERRISPFDEAAGLF